ncbi:MAG: hypothetical protein U1F66_08695 [bacterium]
MRFSVPPNSAFSAAPYLAGLETDAELRALSRETDPELFFEALLHYGISRESRGDVETAARIYARVAEQEAFRDRANQRLDAVLGRGAFGPRAEFLARRLAREASDPATLVAMGMAGAAFRLMRLTVFTRLALHPSAHWLTRGFGARALASAAGFAVEAPTFTLAGRLANEALGRESDWSRDALSRDIASSFLVLGALKLGAWGSGTSYRYWNGTGSGLGSRTLGALFQQGGTLAGILLGHRLEQAAGLRPAMDGATTLTDSLAMLLQFHVAGRLGRQAFGENLSRFELELDHRTASLADSLPLRRPAEESLNIFQPALAMAAIGEGKGLSPGSGWTVPGGAVEQYRYPPGGAEGRPKPLRYPPELRRLWEELQPQLQAVPYEGSAEQILARRADFETGDRLWLAQIEDFARLVSGRVEVHGPERVLEPFTSQILRPNPELLHRALEIAGGRGKVFELSLPFANASFGRPNEKGYYSNLRNLMSQVEDALGKGVLLGYSRGGRLTVRLPNFALWEALLIARFGEHAHRLIPVDGLIPRDSVMRLRGKLLAPVGLLLQPAPIHELNGRVHPFFVAFHDLFHATMASMLPANLCRTSSLLYFSALRGLPNSSLKQEHLNRLADLDPGSEFNGNPDDFIRYSLAHYWKSFAQEVDTGTLNQGRMMQYIHFLDRYRGMLRQASTLVESDPFFLGRYEVRIGEFQKQLSDLLRQALQR